MGIIKGVIERLHLRVKKDAMRSWMEQHDHEAWAVAIRHEHPDAPYFLPLYERIRERFPHFRFVISGKAVRFENYPVIDCGVEGLLQPPLFALATDDALRAAPELITDPKALAALLAERRSRRKRRSVSSRSRTSRLARALGIREGLESWPADLMPPRPEPGTQTDSAS